MPRPVNDKMDFVRRYAAGEFGNHAPTWETFEEWASSGYEGLMHIRNRIAGGPTYYNLRWNEVGAKWNYLVVYLKVPEETLYLSAMCPTEATRFQGEVILSSSGLDIRYTTVIAPMRDALAREEKRATGLLAKTLLDHYLCPWSREWLDYLLEAYPEHIVEFSTFGVNWGTEPGYNTVFWEVRNY